MYNNIVWIKSTAQYQEYMYQNHTLQIKPWLTLNKIRNLSNTICVYQLPSHVEESMLVEEVVLLTVFADLVQCGCPPWFVPDANAMSGCACSIQLSEVVKCDEHTQETLLRLDQCMTFNEGLESSVVGACPYPRFSNIADLDFYIQTASSTTWSEYTGRNSWLWRQWKLY